MTTNHAKGQQDSDYIELRSLLIQSAESRVTVEYDEIARRLGRKPGSSFSHWLGGLLEQINQDEHAVGRPLLGALAVKKDTGMPSQAFFHLAEKLELFGGGSKVEATVFWAEEMMRVFSHWKK